METDDLSYYEQRAEAEIEMAQRARDSRAVQAHYRLATIYLDRIHPQESPDAS
jgi:hypothetical protein